MATTQRRPAGSRRFRKKVRWILAVRRRPFPPGRRNKLTFCNKSPLCRAHRGGRTCRSASLR